MSEAKNQKPNCRRILLKILGAIAVVSLFIAVVGFGLLVGACGTLKR
jgi:hypothetical protein